MKNVIIALCMLAAAGPAAAQTAPGCKSASLRCPVDGGCKVTSAYGKDRKLPDGRIRDHNGTDYEAKKGTKIIAAATGVVEESRLGKELGNFIVLRHQNGDATLYAHLMERSVKVGDPVTGGAQIGLSNNTGTSFGDHLHVEYVGNGAIILSPERIDPAACISQTVQGSIVLSDNGTLADDAFRLAIDGLVFGETQIGQRDGAIAVSNLLPGEHTMVVTAIVAPDNAGTLLIVLKDGWTFTDGLTSKSTTIGTGQSATYKFIVPKST